MPGRPDLGSLDKSSACLGSGDAGDFEVGGAVERNGNGAIQVDMLEIIFFESRRIPTFLTNGSTAGPVGPVRKCLSTAGTKKIRREM